MSMGLVELLILPPLTILVISEPAFRDCWVPLGLLEKMLRWLSALGGTGLSLNSLALLSLILEASLEL